MNEFKIVMDNGSSFYIRAESRKDAIKVFCDEYGVSDWYVREHCTVRNMGRIK